MNILGANSLAAAVNTLNGGVFKRRRCLTAIPGLQLVQRSVRFPYKTVQFQPRKLLHLNKSVQWHDTINNSITSHSSKFYNPSSHQELIEEIRALPCPIPAIVYCHRNNPPPIFDRLPQSFLTVHAVRRLLSHRKLKNNALLRNYSELPLDISLEIRIFLTSKHISDLRQLKKKNSRLSNKRRRSRFPHQQQQLQRPPQHPPFSHHHRHQEPHTR